jgi:IS5 family transposase
MSDQKGRQMSFGDMELSGRSTKETFLDKVNEIIDWTPIERILRRKYKKKAAADGRPAYPALPMFKMLLIQRWYNLSDPALEAAMCDRISFLRFVGFSLESSIPDETTICRFRNALAKRNLFGRLLSEINKQLEANGLLVRNGAIVDAGLIASSRRPRKVIDIMPEDRKEGQTGPESESYKVSYSDDVEAAWVRKGNTPHYGYKMHMAVAPQGFVLGGHVTPANVSDTSEFTRLVGNLGLCRGADLFADKGYTSAKNRDFLERCGYRDGIMYRAVRGRPLDENQKDFNKRIGKIRYKVEQGFGTLKRQYGLFRARYVGKVKTQAEFLLAVTAFNIKKAVNMAF